MTRRPLALPPHERVLVALDVPTLEAATALVHQLRGHVGGFKVGLELCNAVGVPQVFTALQAAGSGSLFLDLKLKDIPNTVGRAVAALVAVGGAQLRMLTLHSDGGTAMLRAAAEAATATAARQGTPPPLLLGVTVLTSMDAAALVATGVPDAPAAQVVRLARLAQQAGLGGVVASPHELRPLRVACGDDFILVTPGIRLAGDVPGDQQRVSTPAAARADGADYLVVGRPITAAADPLAAVHALCATLPPA